MQTRFTSAFLALALCPALAVAEPDAPEVEAVELHAASPAEPSVLPETVDPTVWELLDANLATLAGEPVKVEPRAHADPNAPSWQRAERPNGSAQITVKKPLPLEWDARVGVDLNPAASPVYDPVRQPFAPTRDRGTAAAWAKVAVPSVAAVEVRMNSEQDKSKLGATLSRSVPLGEHYAVTFENSFVVSEPIGGPTPAAPSAATRSFSTDRLVKFDILGSGTTLAAGTTTSTADNTTRGKLIAEQKIYGPLNVTTTLSDIGAPTAAKSVSAGFKLNW